VLDTDSVRHAYRRWAPVYDHTFGQVAEAGRKHAATIVNERVGTVLEVGVGTGLSLPFYGAHLTVTGIDLSPEMLEKARARVEREKLENVAGLHEMDASALAVSDGSFDTVVAMYVMTVVPEPEKVMRELERVCATGGEVILVNHFSRDGDLRGWLERRLAPFADLLGWHSVFPVERVLVCKDLRLVERRSLRPVGLFTMLRFVKEPGHAGAIEGAAEAGCEPAEGATASLAGAESNGIRIKWSPAHALAQARRLLDTNYWRSLYRRRQGQVAE
jgi:phosphatidylethanolamine/phosphatidyl-N-methylethanolamine N-methyltransferase